jgi:hypothetical protein
MLIYAVIENQTVVNKCIAHTEDVVPSNWVLCDNSVEIGWRYLENRFEKVTPETLALSVEEQALNVRSERQALLRQSDWTQVADTPVDQAAWATYRQALRDISSQEGFPWTIEWPTQP